MKTSITNTRTFRPFREENLSPLTLREELKDRYLPAMIGWLVEKGWPAARTAGSLWQIAELTVALVDWLKLIDDSTEYLSLSRRVEMTLLEEVIPFLLEHTTRSADGYSTWDEHVYDTSLVITALLKGIYFLGSKVPTPKRKTVVASCVSSLKWLKLRSLDAQQMDALLAMKDSSLAMMLEAWQTAVLLSKKNMIGGLQPNEEVKRLTNELLRRAQHTDQVLRWGGHAEVLKRMAQACEYLSKKKWQNDLMSAIRDGIQTIEKDLSIGRHEIGPARVEALDAYLRASMIIAHIEQAPPSINENVVLPQLYQMCWEIDAFSDGSVYHSLQVTTYAAGCLTSILDSHWPKIDEAIIKIYRDALREMLVEEQTAKLRQEIFDDRRREQEIRKRLHQAFHREKVYQIILACIVFVVVLGYAIIRFNLIYSGDRPSFLAAIAAVITLLAAILGVMLTIIWQRLLKE